MTEHLENNKELKEFLENGHLVYRFGLTIDCAIFGYRDGELRLLLVKSKMLTKWCLPGGYVKNNETLDDAAARITTERTSIANLFLKQFKTFANPGRNEIASFDLKKFYDLMKIKLKRDSWILKETVSVGFYAITDIVNAKPGVDFLSSECKWFSIDELPELGFDHEEMVREALSAMRIHLYHFPIGKNFLPQKFTLKDVKLFYEVMSGRQLHASNFPNKLIALGIIVKLGEKKNIGAHRSPAYYQFDETTYEKALKEGLVLV